MSNLDLIAIDADDTLWAYEPLYVEAQTKISRLLAAYGQQEKLKHQLAQAEMRYLPLYGYGVKGFVLSMIEAAVDLSQGKISGSEVQALIGYGREMLAAGLPLLEGVPEVWQAVFP